MCVCARAFEGPDDPRGSAASCSQVYLPDKFEEAGARLRDRFVREGGPGFLFDLADKRRTPGSDVAEFARRVWQVIRSHEQLNLPSQRQMLAVYRCVCAGPRVRAPAPSSPPHHPPAALAAAIRSSTR